MILLAWVSLSILVVTIVVSMIITLSVPFIYACIIHSVIWGSVIAFQFLLGCLFCFNRRVAPPSLCISQMIVLMNVILLPVLGYCITSVYNFGSETRAISIYNSKELNSKNYFTIKIKEPTSLDPTTSGCYRFIMESEYTVAVASYQCVFSIKPMCEETKQVYAWYFTTATSHHTIYLNSSDILKDVHYDGRVTRFLPLGRKNGIKLAINEACNRSDKSPCNDLAPVFVKGGISPESMMKAIPILSTFLAVGLLMNILITSYKTIRRDHSDYQEIG